MARILTILCLLLELKLLGQLPFTVSDYDWQQFPVASGGGGTPVTNYFTSSTSWTVPLDWNSGNNSIEAIGGGGGYSGETGGAGQPGILRIIYTP